MRGALRSSRLGEAQIGPDDLTSSRAAFPGASDLSTLCEARDVLARAERECLDGHRRLAATGRHEAAAVAHEQIWHVVAAVITVDDRRSRVVAHATRAEEVH